MDIPLTTEQVGSIRRAYTELGEAYHRILRLDAGLESACAGTTEITKTSFYKLDFWGDIVNDFAKMDGALAESAVLTDGHQSVILRLSLELRQLAGLQTEVYSLAKGALDSGLLGDELSLDRIRHSYQHQITAAVAPLASILRNIMPLIDGHGSNQAQHPLIKPASGRPREV